MSRKSLLLLLIFPITLFAQNIGWVYQHMPTELTPILNSSQRFELVENAKEGRYDTITNALKGQSYITYYNEQQNLIKVAQTGNSLLEIKTLPISATDYFIVVIHTVSAPVSSSTITLYNNAWVKQNIQLPAFKTSDFLQPNHTLNEDELSDLTPIFISAEFSPSAESIVFTNQSHKTLPEKQQEQYLPFLQTYMIPIEQILP